MRGSGMTDTTKDQVKQLTSRLERLAMERRNLANVKFEEGKVTAELHETELYRRLELVKETAKAHAKDAANLRTEIDLLVMGYVNRGDPILDELPKGITAIQKEVLSYAEREAILYCASRYPAALNLRKRDFETMARACLSYIPALDAVAFIRKEPRVRIASDLSAYLPKVEPVGDEEPRGM